MARASYRHRGLQVLLSVSICVHPWWFFSVLRLGLGLGLVRIEVDAVAQHLLDAALVGIALEGAQPVDEELAVEVVELVLERHRQQAVGLDLDLALVERPRPEQDLGAALHLGGVVDDTETALFPQDRAPVLNDDRIDELEEVLAGIL